MKSLYCLVVNVCIVVCVVSVYCSLLLLLLLLCHYYHYVNCVAGRIHEVLGRVGLGRQRVAHAREEGLGLVLFTHTHIAASSSHY